MFIKNNNHQVGEHRSISITRIRPATSDEWDFIWRECDYSTYYHSREWAEIWNVYSKGRIRPDPKLVLFSDEKKALLPISSQRDYNGLVKIYISSPPGAYGGWISTDKLNVAHAFLLADYLTKKNGNLFWQLNPYDELALKTGVRTTRDLETRVLNLAGGFDAVYRGWTKGHKSAVHKASNAGVKIKLASMLGDWLTYYHVYEESLCRWGERATSVYGWDFFNEMFWLKSPNSKLWLAVYQDKIIAGALCLYAKKHVVYWHGAALAEHFHLRPVNLLMYEAIKNACEQGYSWFDLGCSGGHEGVEAFKKSFGAEALACPVVSTETMAYSFIKKIGGIIIRILPI
ncbi:MAG: GNAT family N-acetyltransferase [Thermodesulfobacteriota bacterium]|nr:GNAT family N-acetyltransferase [Thermodesulfobacteriota bacterium]